MATAKVATKSEIPEDRGLGVVAGERRVALFRIGDEVFALQNKCPHRGVPISNGQCQNGEVTCPKHDARFDIRTGKHLCGPATSDIRVYPVQLDGDDVYVEYDQFSGPLPPQLSKTGRNTRPTASPEGEAVRTVVKIRNQKLTEGRGFGMLLGSLLTALAAGVIGFLTQRSSERAHKAEVESLKGQITLLKKELDEPAAPLLAAKPPNPDDVKQITDIADAIFEELRAGKVEEIYKRLSEEFKSKVTLEQFQEKIAKVPSTKWMTQKPEQRKTSLQRANDFKGYIYRIESPLTAALGLVKATMIFVPDEGAWKLAGFDLKQDR